MHTRRLVVFGCGYVGRSLARRAAGLGWEVWIQSRNAASLQAVAAVPAHRRLVCDLHGPDWHGRLPGPWDAAVNLVSSAGGGLDGYRLSYLEGNRSILAWAERVPVERFIYTSATSVYPQVHGEWVGEDDVPALECLSPTARVLRQAELEVLGAGVFARRVVARLAGIYGPGRHLYLDQLRAGASVLPGDGAGWLNLIYLKDIVDVLLMLLEAPLREPAGVFNVVDDAPARRQDIAEWLAARLGVAAVRFDPALEGPRSAQRAGPEGPPNRRVSNARLRGTLGWKPRFPDFRAGYADILAAGDGLSRSI